MKFTFLSFYVEFIDLEDGYLVLYMPDMETEYYAKTIHSYIRLLRCFRTFNAGRC